MLLVNVMNLHGSVNGNVDVKIDVNTSVISKSAYNTNTLTSLNEKKVLGFRVLKNQNLGLTNLILGFRV